MVDLKLANTVINFHHKMVLRSLLDGDKEAYDLHVKLRNEYEELRELTWNTMKENGEEI